MYGLGVPNQAFFALQDNMLQQLADMLIREDAAVDALVQVKSCIFCHRFYCYKDTRRQILI